MGIADRIAAKRAELAQFVTDNAAAVIAEDMSDQMRGAAALDLLKLMVASGLAAPSGPLLDVTPAPVAVDQDWTPKRFKMTYPKSYPKKKAASPAPVVERKKRFTDSMIAAALEAAGGVQAAAAEALGCSDMTVYAHRKRTGLIAAEAKVVRRAHSDVEIAAALEAVDGDRRRAAESLGCGLGVIDRYRSAAGLTGQDGKVRWTRDAYARLREIATRSPRPSLADMAAEMGTTPSAIQTALSRGDITRQDRSMADLSALQKRDCMTCSKPFLSEGRGNRMCSRCVSGSMECAA